MEDQLEKDQKVVVKIPKSLLVLRADRKKPKSCSEKCVKSSSAQVGKPDLNRLLRFFENCQVILKN